MSQKLLSHVRNQWMGALALFIALATGGAYAVEQIGRNSVGAPQIKRNAVGLSEHKDNSVGTAEVIDDSLTGVDISESTLGGVPSATNADHAGSADNATSADSATNADHATSADTATNAGNAGTLGGMPPGAFQAQGSEGWQPLGFNQNTAVCYWTAFGGTSPSYFRDRDGVVHLRGLVQAHDGTGLACQALSVSDQTINYIHPLPAGYRPDQGGYFTISANDTPGRVNVDPGGDISVDAVTVNYPTFANAKIWLSLDGITFRCAPSGQNGCP